MNAYPMFILLSYQSPFTVRIMPVLFIFSQIIYLLAILRLIVPCNIIVYERSINFA